MVYILDIIYPLNALFIFLLCYHLLGNFCEVFLAVSATDSKLKNLNYKIIIRKIPHTGDKASLDRCR